MTAVKSAFMFTVAVLVATALIAGPGLSSAQPTPDDPTATATAAESTPESALATQTPASMPTADPTPLVQGKGASLFVPGVLVLKFRDQTSLATAGTVKAAHGLQTIHVVGTKGAELHSVTIGSE